MEKEATENASLQEALDNLTNVTDFAETHSVLARVRPLLGKSSALDDAFTTALHGLSLQSGASSSSNSSPSTCVVCGVSGCSFDACHRTMRSLLRLCEMRP